MKIDGCSKERGRTVLGDAVDKLLDGTLLEFLHHLVSLADSPIPSSHDLGNMLEELGLHE